MRAVLLLEVAQPISVRHIMTTVATQASMYMYTNVAGFTPNTSQANRGSLGLKSFCQTTWVSYGRRQTLGASHHTRKTAHIGRSLFSASGKEPRHSLKTADGCAKGMTVAAGLSLIWGCR